jgi:hypothetical protein
MVNHDIMKKTFLLIVILVSCTQILYLLLSACSPMAAAPTLIPSETPQQPTEFPTDTPVWFPPTATPTPFPTATLSIPSTQEVRPSHGSLIFSDDFSSDSPWTVGRTSQTSRALNNQQLTLALSQPGGYLYSVREEPVLREYYAEITASPSLCLAGDQYGLLLRFNDADNFFRFALTCDGQARVDRLFKGQPSSPQPLTFFGAIPPGAPSSSRLAFSILGRQIDFYVNDEYLFSVSDPNLLEGKIGVFVRSAGENALTVNFSNLEVFEIE